MARASRLIRPENQELLRLRVLRAERLSPHWMRVTLGGGDIDRFTPLGYDQWFRIFLPLGGEEAIDRIPANANKMLGYLKFMRIPDGVRPVMRSYSVRAYRTATADAGAELDVDFVLHGSVAEGTAGPASRWAETVQPGETVVIIDEGIVFGGVRPARQVLLAADETGLPAVANICASLPDDATGLAIVEVPTEDDRQQFAAPTGVEVRWIVRASGARPGAAALEAVQALPAPASGTHCFLVGEQALPTGARRHLVAQGVDKADISFVGYWRYGHSDITPRSQRAAEH